MSQQLGSLFLFPVEKCPPRHCSSRKRRDVRCPVRGRNLMLNQKKRVSSYRSRDEDGTRLLYAHINVKSYTTPLLKLLILFFFFFVSCIAYGVFFKLCRSPELSHITHEL